MGRGYYNSVAVGDESERTSAMLSSALRASTATPILSRSCYPVPGKPKPGPKPGPTISQDLL